MAGRSIRRSPPRRRRRTLPPLLLRYGRCAWTVPAALYLGVVLVGTLGGPSMRVGTWLALVPAVASSMCPPLVTAGFGVLAIGTNRVVDALVSTDHLRPEDFVLTIVSAVLAVVVSVMRKQVRTYLGRVQDAAQATRQVVLHPIPPGWGGLDSAARYLAANAEARVGGDFYEVLETPYGARVLLGDVQGKGLPAVSTAAALTGTFRESGYHKELLSQVAERLEQRLDRHNRLRARLGEAEGRFATAVVLAFPEQGVLDLVNFGHDGPLVIGPGGVRRLPEGEGPPLGLVDLAGGLPPVVRLPLYAGETVLLVTDGVTEARDGRGDFFPLRDWLESLAARHPAGVEPDELLTDLVEAVLRHTDGHLDDDAALLAVRPSTWAATS
ncbi:PP2C family protein-serine/threonine phosphatase [Streptomyces polyrhachis]|uniref:PP2C family protein-serine/threonine phosphatase n=1 Tax=Streptomyces polyrhachis TaxID=1282885 RepID=A0ABW2G8K1_9ACTN